ncbi:MAG: DUF1559 domain-containing protein [Pirellulaceae bacterium]
MARRDRRDRDLDRVVAARRANGAESARRIHCANNLRELGLAAFEYESTFQQLPPGQRFPQGLLWSAYLLPFIEQQPAFDRLDPESVRVGRWRQ